jgi:hypothetical protein
LIRNDFVMQALADAITACTAPSAMPELDAQVNCKGWMHRSINTTILTIGDRASKKREGCGKFQFTIIAAVV